MLIHIKSYLSFYSSMRLLNSYCFQGRVSVVLVSRSSNLNVNNMCGRINILIKSWNGELNCRTLLWEDTTNMFVTVFLSHSEDDFLTF